MAMSAGEDNISRACSGGREALAAKLCQNSGVGGYILLSGQRCDRRGAGRPAEIDRLEVVLFIDAHEDSARRCARFAGAAEKRFGEDVLQSDRLVDDSRRDARRLDRKQRRVMVAAVLPRQQVRRSR